MYQQIVKLYPYTAIFYTNTAKLGINTICVTQPHTFHGKHCQVELLTTGGSADFNY